MPGTSQHIIRQQHLHVEVNGTESDGLALQHNLPGLCRDWLMPAVEQALERYTQPEGYLCIERLDVDAGAMTIDRLKHDLAETVRRSIEKSLRERLPPEDSLPAMISDGVLHKDGIVYKTKQHTIHEAFIYFLTAGSLPWSFRLPAGSSLEQTVSESWQDKAISGLDQVVSTDDVVRALALKTARKRLIRQFSTSFLEKLLLSLSPTGKKEMEAVLETLCMFDAPPKITKQLKRHLWETAFANVVSGKVFTSRELVSEFWNTLPITTDKHAALASVLEKHWSGLMGKGQTRHKKITEPIQPKHPETVPPNKTDLISPTISGAETPPIDIIEHPDEGEGIYIENAGLVILHPFLMQFFEALEIVAEDRLLQPERALCLLHFLTTGQLFAPEYELVLPKILCNVPLETPVASDVALTAAEQEEASVLLQAVIRHWEVLRNTSPDGLRGTFLLRPGKLCLRDGGDWLLQVESNTFDILLDQLPWGISMIKLPWMEKMLWVEWR